MNKNGVKNILDIALHPVRMRILMLLAGKQGLTPQQMAEQMSDVPQATLYRHINKLAQAGLLVVTADRPVRGTLEKVYALNQATRPFISEEAAVAAFNSLSRAEHQRYFTTFVMTLVDDFTRYLNHRQGDLDMAADGVGYHKIPLFLSDVEMGQMAVALNQALLPFLNLQDTPERKKRIFSTIMLPDVEPGSE